MEVNLFDAFSSITILLSLALIPKHYKWWLLYSFGCLCWILLHFQVDYYFGMLMNGVACAIGLINFKKKNNGKRKTS